MPTSHDASNQGIRMYKSTFFSNITQVSQNMGWFKTQLPHIHVLYIYPQKYNRQEYIRIEVYGQNHAAIESCISIGKATDIMKDLTWLGN